MKVAIFDYDHFQYALTISELFEGHEKIFIVSQSIHDDMLKYAPHLSKGEFIINEEKELKDNYVKIANVLNEQEVDLFSVNPIFDHFQDFYSLMNSLKGEILFTVHNLNYWYKPRFRSPRGIKERAIKRKILKRANYIAVEDFLYQYIQTEKPSYSQQNKFVYIPFTFFSNHRIEKDSRVSNRLKVVLPGSIDKYRRNYEAVITVIERFAEEKANICFSFAGPALGEYGANVLKRLKEANEKINGIAIYFEEQPKPEQFKFEMSTADMVLSTSNYYYDGLGTREYIGKTKPTAAIHDMMSYELPGLLPSHLCIPENLKSSSISYNGSDELYSYLAQLLENPLMLDNLKNEAILNSKKFTAEKIREGLPFFNRTV